MVTEGFALSLMTRPACIVWNDTARMLLEFSGASAGLEKVPAPKSEHPADTAMVVLWRPRPWMKGKEERLRVSDCSRVSRLEIYGVVKWIRGSREKSRKEKLGGNIFQLVSSAGRRQSKA